MNYFKKLGVIAATALLLVSCFNKREPNYQFMPNMYESVGYETYQKSAAFPGGFEAMLPPANTIKRGFVPYTIPNTIEGKAEAMLMRSPLDSLNMEADLKVGKELYEIYCGVCHGSKGDGQGILAQREKFVGVPAYDAREINIGSTYHVIYYGLNSMGSYKNQLNEKERWQVAAHVMKLRENLVK
ncbi:MAG: cytochrome c [Flavobacteriaceae bacterium]|nr:cytochrome c [Flavobacteriaceae bacterium]